MGRTGSFFALLTGIAAGITLGILYAPDKGWKTRARVRKAAENGYDDLKENLGEVGAKIDGKAGEARESLKGLRETLREKGSEIKEGTRELLLRQLERLEDALKQAEDTAEESVSQQPDDQAPQA